jgi:glycosyltransferase involved in cell wall biosynthesis
MTGQVTARCSVGTLRVVPQLRSADFERSRRADRHTVIYVSRYPDLDETSVRANTHRVGLAGAWRWAFRADWRVVELAEPLWLRALPLIVSVGWAVRLADLLRRRRTRIVCYAMENSPPFQLLRGLPAWLHPVAFWVLRLLAGRLFDRVAFASTATERLYRQMRLLSAGCATALYQDLHEPCPECPSVRPARRMCYLGALEPRKGVFELLAAWRTTRLGQRGWELAVAGAGPLSGELRRAAVADPSIRPLGLVDRPGTHRLLAESAVVVLPSRREGRWREQIGMSIIEGLAHGCHVLATPDTGLADWLSEHGHTVLPEDFTQADLVRALCAVGTERLGTERVLAALPSVAGRVAAEDWLYRPTPTDTVTGGT